MPPNPSLQQLLPATTMERQLQMERQLKMEHRLQMERALL